MSCGGVGEAITRDGCVHVTASMDESIQYSVTLGEDVRDKSAEDLADEIKATAKIAFQRVLAEMRRDIETRGQSQAISTGWPTHAEVDALERELLG